ncbi:MAG TPA: beta-galactosidase, partial [Jatrophihabitans sp.]|nr:beta-galactosidase [Jatrophihabitans sp.]
MLLGEYPYYRADPAHWAGNLGELRGAGVDVLTCYLPWRLHEYPDGAGYSYDFTGTRAAQHDVARLLRLAQQAGLAVVLKPGPFIHAEVQLGGLPDRLCGR